MNPSTHPHEFVKHTEPDYIIQPGDLYQTTICSTCYGPFGASVGDALGMSGFKTAWTPRPIPPYDTSKYDYVSDPSYVIREGDLIWLEPETGWETVNDCTPGRTLAFLNAGLEDCYDNVYGVLTPKNVAPKPTDSLHDTIRDLRATLDRRNEVVVKLVDQIAAMHVALRKIRAAADEASRNTTF